MREKVEASVSDRLVEFAQKAIITRKGELLMVHKSEEHPFHPGMWDLPGGRLGQGETLDEAICREVREEIGVDVIPSSRPLSMWKWEIGDSGECAAIVVVTRLCTITSDIDPHLTDNAVREHIVELKWVPFDDVGKCYMLQEAKDQVMQAVSLIA